MKSIDDFLSHISKEDFPDGEWSELIQALWWAKKGDWERAHNIAQDVESNDGFQGTCLFASSRRRLR